MNQTIKYVGFCFAILLGILNISGALAGEKPLFFSAEENSDSVEILQLSDHSPPWAPEEVLRDITLPEYSENQFSRGNLIPDGFYVPSEVIDQPEKSPFILKRDLRAVIKIQLFPFHFFL